MIPELALQSHMSRGRWDRLDHGLISGVYYEFEITSFNGKDMMGRVFQNQLLSFMESGNVDVEQQRRQYHFKIEGAKVFATCNELNRLSKPLQVSFQDRGS